MRVGAKQARSIQTQNPLDDTIYITDLTAFEYYVATQVITEEVVNWVDSLLRLAEMDEQVGFPRDGKPLSRDAIDDCRLIYGLNPSRWTTLPELEAHRIPLFMWSKAAKSCAGASAYRAQGNVLRRRIGVSCELDARGTPLPDRN